MPLRLKVVSRHKKRLGNAHWHEFDPSGGSIGRAAYNDWVLPDSKRFLSSKHAMIDYQGGAYYLVDISRNGVFINDSDTAVGRGNPQRLFEGDRVRIGEYEMLVELAADDEGTSGDALQDSIVRAQLVPLDETPDAKLVDERRIDEHDALEPHLADPEGSALIRAMGANTVVRSPRPVGRLSPPTPPLDPAVDQFFAAAGLRPEDLRGSTTEEVLQTAGQLLRELLNGLEDLLHSRARMKDSLRLSNTIIQPLNNNPLKFSPGVSEALRYLLGEQGESYLPPEQAVRAAFKDVRIHQQAMFKAMAHAVRDIGERFDPAELRNRFDGRLKRSPLLGGSNKQRYWELYEETYESVMHKEAGALLPQVVSDEFVQAYEEESEALRHARPAGKTARPASSR